MRFVCIDNKEDDIESLRLILESHQHEFKYYHQRFINEFFQDLKLSGDEIECVFIDERMGKVSGHKIIEDINNLEEFSYRFFNVVMFTGAGSTDLHNRINQYGADYYIEKDSKTLDELLNIIEEVLPNLPRTLSRRKTRREHLQRISKENESLFIKEFVQNYDKSVKVYDLKEDQDKLIRIFNIQESFFSMLKIYNQRFDESESKEGLHYFHNPDINTLAGIILLENIGLSDHKFDKTEEYSASYLQKLNLYFDNKLYYGLKDRRRKGIELGSNEKLYRFFDKTIFYKSTDKETKVIKQSALDSAINREKPVRFDSNLAYKIFKNRTPKRFAFLNGLVNIKFKDKWPCTRAISLDKSDKKYETFLSKILVENPL